MSEEPIKWLVVAEFPPTRELLGTRAGETRVAVVPAPSGPLARDEALRRWSKDAENPPRASASVVYVARTDAVVTYKARTGWEAS